MRLSSPSHNLLKMMSSVKRFLSQLLDTVRNSQVNKSTTWEANLLRIQFFIISFLTDRAGATGTEALPLLQRVPLSKPVLTSPNVRRSQEATYLNLNKLLVFHQTIQSIDKTTFDAYFYLTADTPTCKDIHIGFFFANL